MCVCICGYVDVSSGAQGIQKKEPLELELWFPWCEQSSDHLQEDQLIAEPPPQAPTLSYSQRKLTT